MYLTITNLNCTDSHIHQIIIIIIIIFFLLEQPIIICIGLIPMNPSVIGTTYNVPHVSSQVSFSGSPLPPHLKSLVSRVHGGAHIGIVWTQKERARGEISPRTSLCPIHVRRHHRISLSFHVFCLLPTSDFSTEDNRQTDM